MAIAMEFKKLPQLASALAIISARHRHLSAERTPQTDIAPKDSGAH